MTTTQQASGWGRRRLLAALTGAALLAAALLAGLAYVLVGAVTDPAPANPVLVSSTASPAAGPGWRDQVAAAPMLRVDPASARAGTPAVTPGRAIAVPPATREGPAGVPTGYPRTSAGAVGMGRSSCTGQERSRRDEKR